METNFWVGAYTGSNGNAQGISLLRTTANQGDCTLSGVASSPSWVAVNPRVPVLYAALEHAGRVASFAFSADGTLEQLGPERDAGELVCHVAVSDDGRHLIASCYGDGNVIYFALDEDGIPGEPMVAAAAGEPYASEIGRPSRAHQAIFLNDFRVLTTDLGRDLIRLWEVSAVGLELVQELALDLGSGPRHMAAHSSGVVFVVTEYSNEILTLAQDGNGVWGQLASVAVAKGHQPGQDSPAEICLNEEGTALYVAVRGANTMCTFAVATTSARLELLSVTESGGEWPRHHLVSGAQLLVANQLSDTISVFALDSDTGVPGELISTIASPSPTCLAPWRA